MTAKRIVISVASALAVSVVLRTALYTWLVGYDLIVGQLATILLSIILGYFLYHRRSWARWITIALSAMVAVLSVFSIARATMSVDSAGWMVVLALSGYIVIALTLPRSVGEYFSDRDEARAAGESEP
ncbi:MAG: hypothetical protein IID05_10470 [Gemmatimonadetes bacterium]|nr:hypothetical protein [Gemmatimonadota bacterium]